jgi:hypothetical protein
MVAALALAACGSATSSSPAGEATAAPATGGPTEVPIPTTTPPPFACGEPIERAGTVPRAQITGLKVVNDGGVGRLTFTFAPEGNVAAVPAVRIEPASPPFTQDPSGLPIEVPGSAFVTVVLQGGTALDENMEPTFGGPFDLDPEGSPIVALRRAGDFEGVSTWVVGLDRAPCVRVLPLDGSSRLVIEVKGS